MVFLKAVSKLGKSGAKMFTLHGIDSSKVASNDTLKAEMKKGCVQLVLASVLDV